jgi:hypothetical protein
MPFHCWFLPSRFFFLSLDSLFSCPLFFWARLTFEDLEFAQFKLKLTNDSVARRSPSQPQRCQMIFFKSARSVVKTRQNLPSRIDEIRQKSARNWDDFRPFFTLKVFFFVWISPHLRSGQGKNIDIF